MEQISLFDEATIEERPQDVPDGDVSPEGPWTPEQPETPGEGTESGSEEQETEAEPDE